MTAPSLADITAAGALAYYLTGLNMVLVHAGHQSLDRPRYVDLGLARRVLAGASWPFVTFLDGEFSWHAICFCGAVVVMSAEFYLIGRLVDDAFWQALIVWALCITPIVNVPLTFVSALLWMVFAKPFGMKTPSRIGRRFS